MPIRTGGRIMFQRRHYQAIAEVLAYSNASDTVIESMCNMFERDNPNFNRNTFSGVIAGLKVGGR